MLSAWEKILPILRSPCCQAVLTTQENELLCSACHHVYGLEEGILVMLPPSQTDRETSE